MAGTAKPRGAARSSSKKGPTGGTGGTGGSGRRGGTGIMPVGGITLNEVKDGTLVRNIVKAVPNSRPLAAPLGVADISCKILNKVDPNNSRAGLKGSNLNCSTTLIKCSKFRVLNWLLFNVTELVRTGRPAVLASAISDITGRSKRKDTAPGSTVSGVFL